MRAAWLALAVSLTASVALAEEKPQYADPESGEATAQQEQQADDETTGVLPPEQPAEGETTGVLPPEDKPAEDEAGGVLPPE